MTLKKLLIFALIIVIVIFSLPTILREISKKVYPLKYIEIVDSKAKKYNIDSYLILAIIRNESNFNKDAKSKAGAKGLMQVVDSTADEVAKELMLTDYEIEHIYDPEINIEIGTKYLTKLFNQFDNNVLLAVAAYNAGPGKVNSWLEDEVIDENDLSTIPYKETNSYVRRVMRDYEIYKNLYE
jgi:soluble lytic murein transglycosylase